MIFVGRLSARDLLRKRDLAEALNRLGNDRVEELTIQHVVSHGKAGAVNGISKLKNGKMVAFAKCMNSAEQKGTSVREITSYAIEIS